MKKIIMYACFIALLFTAFAGPITSAGNEGERVTLRVLGAYGGVGEFYEGDDENNNIFVDFLKENTPYDFYFTFFADAEARNALIAAGEQFDVLKMSNSNDVRNLLIQDYIAPIDEYLPLAQYLMDDTPPEVWKVAKYNGSTYGIPQAWSECYVGFAMRVDWLDQLGLSAPADLDELKQVLIAFKEFDPGNGANVIPLTAGGLRWGGIFELFRSIWGIHSEYMAIDDKVEFVMATEKGKDMMAYVADLYAQGLIDQEVSTMNGNIIGQRLLTDQIGSGFVPWWDLKSWDLDFIASTGGSPFQYVALPNGPDGKPSTILQYGPIEHIMVFPKTGHPAEGVDFINRLFDPAIAETLCFGWEGVHWNRDANGARQFTEAIDEITYRWQYCDNLAFRQDFMTEMENMEYGNWRTPLEQWAGGIGTAALLMPAVQGVEQLQDNVTSHYDNEIAKFLMGERPMSEYDDFIGELKNLGLDDILAAMQAVYDANK